jgi:hypothetical protein
LEGGSEKDSNLISVPDKTDPLDFLLLLSATWESIEFTPIGGIILNRGADQENLTFTGLNYVQQVSDAVTNGALHVEAGQWLTIPPVPATLAARSILTSQEFRHVMLNGSMYCGGRGRSNQHRHGDARQRRVPAAV